MEAHWFNSTVILPFQVTGTDFLDHLGRLRFGWFRRCSGGAGSTAPGREETRDLLPRDPHFLDEFLLLPLPHLCVIPLRCLQIFSHDFAVLAGSASIATV